MTSNDLPRTFEVWRLAFECEDQPGVSKERPVVIGALDSLRAVYHLRQVTLVECHVTTREDVLLEIAGEAGINAGAFRSAFADGQAEAALETDMRFASSVGVRSLPAFLVSCGERAILLHGVLVHGEFEEAVSKLIGCE